jgi:hypothetical protein
MKIRLKDPGFDLHPGEKLKKTFQKEARLLKLTLAIIEGSVY